jgi:hypothetical protein
MKQKNLIIIHTKKNLIIDQQNVSYINIGNGTVSIENSKKIILSKYREVNYLKYKNLLIKELSKKLINTEKKIPFISELEIFNLRNDKNTNIDLILNILIIKEIIRKNKFKKISVITDNKLIKDLFKQVSPKIKIVYKGSNFLIPNLILLKIIKFYFKAFFVICYAKIINKKKVKSKKFSEACLSIYPIFYKKKEIFFNDKKKIKLNFLLTDETHLNFSFIKIIQIITQTKNKDLIHIENFVTFKSFFKSFMKAIFYYFLSLRVNFKLNINNLNLSSFYEEYFFTSLINRSKLNIYEDSIILAFKKFEIKIFSLYLFEYNFGFFLINLIKKKIVGIKIIGHQHGIFSDQLLWLDLILKNKNKYNYLPDEIISFNLQSYKDYKKQINSKKIKFTLVKKTQSMLINHYAESKDKKYSNNILVLCGTHDAIDIYNVLKNKILDKENKKIFFLKFHPKKVISTKDTSNLKIITKIKNQNFSNVLISPTSTLVYDFMNSKNNFMVYNIDYKKNLISEKLKNKINFYYF